MSELPSDLPTVYCPRCDKPFRSALKRTAWRNMLKHLRTNHPDYYEEFKEEHS